MKTWASLWLAAFLGVFAIQARAADKTETLSMPNVNGVAANPVVIHEDAVDVSEEQSCSRGNCLSRLRNWLCYRPIQPAAKCGCKMQEPCCRPQLHAFFLHRCNACAEDNCEGIPITFSYTDLLRQSGPCIKYCGGCGVGYAAGCATCK